MIEALGNIGDFIGGIGVVITLLYLALQIRQNSRSVRSASAQAMLASLSQTVSAIGVSSQASGVFAKGQLDPDGLTDEEATQFAHLILGWFRVVEQAFYQNRLGGLDTELWDGYVAQLRSFMQSPGVQRWWSVRAPLFHAEFRRFIDDRGTTPPFLVEPPSSVYCVAIRRPPAESARPDRTLHLGNTLGVVRGTNPG